ncbi:MAG: hypothetical protein Q8934_22620 [Bacillota bacterium]|nr:hypothetical protein [Bacillota bacterium]
MAQQNQRQNALKDYVEVNVRVEQFYTKYPNGRIITNLLSWNDGVVVMKAEVYRDLTDQVPSATGHAYEKEGSSFINKTSALENCETSAVGRALALLGFEIKKSIASKEEVENAKLNQNETPTLINSKEFGELKTKVLEFAQLREKTEDEVYAVMKISDPTALTSQDAKIIITKLNGWITSAKKELAKNQKQGA